MCFSIRNGKERLIGNILFLYFRGCISPDKVRGNTGGIVNVNNVYRKNP